MIKIDPLSLSDTRFALPLHALIFLGYATVESLISDLRSMHIPRHRRPPRQAHIAQIRAILAQYGYWYCASQNAYMGTICSSRRNRHGNWRLRYLNCRQCPNKRTQDYTSVDADQLETLTPSTEIITEPEQTITPQQLPLAPPSKTDVFESLQPALLPQQTPSITPPSTDAIELSEPPKLPQTTPAAPFPLPPTSRETPNTSDVMEAVPIQETQPPALSTISIMPPLTEVLCTRFPFIKHFPQRVRSAMRDALSRTIWAAENSTPNTATARRTAVFLFPAAILAHSPTTGAGTERSTSATNIFRNRLSRWMRGDYAGLWREATKCATFGDPAPLSPEEQARIDLQRVIRLAEEVP